MLFYDAKDHWMVNLYSKCMYVWKFLRYCHWSTWQMCCTPLLS